LKRRQFAIPLHFVDDRWNFVARRINCFGGRDNGRNDRLDAINYNGLHQMAAVNETCGAQIPILILLANRPRPVFFFNERVRSREPTGIAERTRICTCRFAVRRKRYCEAHDITGKTVTVKIKYSDFSQATRSQTVLGAVSHVDQMLEIAQTLLASVFPFKRPVRLLGVTLSSLNTEESGQEPQLDLGL
jgi:hypothetical protein